MMNAVNIVDRRTYAFEDVVWPLARKKQIGLVAMKVHGGGIWTCKMPAELRQASFRFAQSVAGVALTVIGMGSVQELEQNVAWAKSFRPMLAAEAPDSRSRPWPWRKSGAPTSTASIARGSRAGPW
jgi:aryl-alcohol dehydrogenase-like predicted oxidoreductase